MTIGQAAQVYRKDGSWSRCTIEAILPDRAVKVAIVGKDNLRKILTKEDILDGYLKVREEVNDAARLPCIGSSNRKRKEVENATPASCRGWFSRAGS